MQIRDKIVLITGASSGIGAAMAQAMSRVGAAQVLLLARSLPRLEKVAGEIKSRGGLARVYPVDLSDSAAIEVVTQRILAEVGVPDILINNAGSGRWKFLAETSAAEIVQMMTLPYFAAAWLTRSLLPGMLARGSGHIVNISSVASRLAWPGASAYIAACRAMRGLSDALRSDLYGTNISVSHYESGPIDSPYWQNNPGSRERVPRIARLLVPVLSEEQVARAVIAGIRNKRRIIVAPVMMQLIYFLHSWFPWLVQGLMTRSGHPPGE